MDARGNLLEAVAQDVRFALRALRHHAGFAAIVVATLALGIGANSALFGLADQIMLRALPIRDPQRLVVLDAPGSYSGHSSSTSATLTPLSHPMFVGIRDRATPFAGVFAHRFTGVHLSVGDRTVSAGADLVSGSFFEVVGVAPLAA